MEQAEEWVTERRYVNKEGLDKLLEENESQRKEKDEADFDLQQEVVFAQVQVPTRQQPQFAIMRELEFLHR